ncbi:MAG: acetolactate synthase small subunit [Chloroflexota bacterium]
MAETKRILVALVENRAGVLNRVASLLRRRGFNIESIAVGRSEMVGLSRMTFVIGGASEVVEQARKQLAKLIDVVKVSDITDSDIVTRELALIKVHTTSVTRGEIMQIVDIFRANIIDVAYDSVTIEITGDEDKIDSLINLLRSYGIKETSRTGRIATIRGGASPVPAEEKLYAARKRGRSSAKGSPVK